MPNILYAPSLSRQRATRQAISPVIPNFTPSALCIVVYGLFAESRALDRLSFQEPQVRKVEPIRQAITSPLHHKTIMILHYWLPWLEDPWASHLHRGYLMVVSKIARILRPRFRRRLGTYNLCSVLRDERPLYVCLRLPPSAFSASRSLNRLPMFKSMCGDTVFTLGERLSSR